MSKLLQLRLNGCVFCPYLRRVLVGNRLASSCVSAGRFLEVEKPATFEDHFSKEVPAWFVQSLSD